MPKLSDPEIKDLIAAIKRGEVDMSQGHATLVKQFPWLEARFLSDDDYKKNFRQSACDVKLALL